MKMSFRLLATISALGLMLGGWPTPGWSLGYQQNTALFLVGNTNLSTADQQTYDLLARRYTVKVKYSGNATGTDALDKSLVVISRSNNTSLIGDKYKDSPTPVLVMSPPVFSFMSMTGPVGGIDRGQVSEQTELFVVHGSPLIGAPEPPSPYCYSGFAGWVCVYPDPVPVTTSPTSFNWGRPADDAHVAARLADGSSYRPAIFSYEKGTRLMDNSVARGRRVGWFAGSWLDSTGRAFFDRAVAWLDPGINISFSPAECTDASRKQVLVYLDRCASVTVSATSSCHTAGVTWSHSGTGATFAAGPSNTLTLTPTAQGSFSVTAQSSCGHSTTVNGIVDYDWPQ